MSGFRKQGMKVEDSEDELSSGRFQVLMDQFNDTKKLQAMRQSMPIEQKICMIDGIKMRNQEVVFGMTPEDYRIYRQLDKIDECGEFQDFNNEPDKSIDSDSGEYGNYLSSDEKFELLMKKIQ